MTLGAGMQMGQQYGMPPNMTAGYGYAQGNPAAYGNMGFPPNPQAYMQSNFAMPSQNGYNGGYAQPYGFHTPQFPPVGNPSFPQNGSSYNGKQYGGDYGRGSSSGGAAPNGTGRGRAGSGNRGTKSAKGTRGTPAGAGSAAGSYGAPANGGMDQYAAQQHAMYNQGYDAWAGGGQQAYGKDGKAAAGHAAFPFATAGFAGYDGAYGYPPQQGQQAAQQQAPPQYAGGAFAGQQQGAWPTDGKAFAGKSGAQY